jgi:phosphate transport system protein
VDLDVKVRKALETLGELVESNVTAAVMSLIDRNVAMAIEVIESHIEIEAQLMVVDTLCRRSLVAAHDDTGARQAFAQICIRSEMARIADGARDFAREVLFLTKKTSIASAADFSRMFEWFERMMRDANRVAIELDLTMAKSLLEMAPAVEAECRAIVEAVLKLAAGESAEPDRELHLIMAVQHLRTMAHSSGNIAQAVVYLKEGRSLKPEYDLPYTMEELAILRRAATIE